MTQITIKGFADQIGIPPETLLRQLDAAGIAAKSQDDALSDDEKEKLFHYLRASHGGSDESAARKKITLKRKSTSQVIQSTRTGASRTVQVEVRKKRTFIKRTAVEETPAPVEEAPVEEPVEAAVAAPSMANAPVSAPVAAAPVA
ncbi:MAG TPA: translation initiation factor IF-2 associated domain-containing protein, partial [Sulfuricaulis sp.]|nr:translation initiation factor IF-2 associated domain-containing protein [Sulfuricaulis sp.]